MVWPTLGSRTAKEQEQALLSIHDTRSVGPYTTVSQSRLVRIEDHSLDTVFYSTADTGGRYSGQTQTAYANIRFRRDFKRSKVWRE